MKPESVSITYSRGRHTVSVGDEFFCRLGTKPGEYRVKALHGLEEFDSLGNPSPGGEFRSATSYSPSGLGGTPTIGCENINTGEIVDFCGDSVASFLAHPDEKPHDWNEEAARKRNAAIYQMWPT